VTWGFIWIMLALKIPLAALIVLVWWAIRQRPSEQGDGSDEGDGGIRRHRRHPRQPFPRRPRRGPHGGQSPSPPARVRTVRARARSLGH